MMRKLLLAGVCAGLLAIAGCTTPQGAPGINLAQVQAEGNAISAALDAGAKIYTSAPSTTPAESAAVQEVLTIAAAANAQLQAAPEGMKTLQVVETVGQDITSVLAVLPIDPATKIGIDAGLAILDTFIAEQLATPVAPPASLTLTAPEHVAPPVPIPAPHVLPPRT